MSFFFLKLTFVWRKQHFNYCSSLNRSRNTPAILGINSCDHTESGRTFSAGSRPTYEGVKVTTPS